MTERPFKVCFRLSTSARIRCAATRSTKEEAEWTEARMRAAGYQHVWVEEAASTQTPVEPDGQEDKNDQTPEPDPNKESDPS